MSLFEQTVILRYALLQLRRTIDDFEGMTSQEEQLLAEVMTRFECENTTQHEISAIVELDRKIAQVSGS